MNESKKLELISALLSSDLVTVLDIVTDFSNDEGELSRALGDHDDWGDEVLLQAIDCIISYDTIDPFVKHYLSGCLQYLCLIR